LKNECITARGKYKQLSPVITFIDQSVGAISRQKMLRGEYTGRMYVSNAVYVMLGIRKSALD